MGRIACSLSIKGPKPLVNYFQVDISRIALDLQLLGLARRAPEREILSQFESMTGCHFELNLSAVESIAAVWLPFVDLVRVHLQVNAWSRHVFEADVETAFRSKEFSTSFGSSGGRPHNF